MGTSKIKESWTLKLKQQKKIKQKRTFSCLKTHLPFSLLRSKENEKLTLHKKLTILKRVKQEPSEDIGPQLWKKERGKRYQMKQEEGS